jgi:anti-sigma regulatory factor (Ser/Thr protein kinase)
MSTTLSIPADLTHSADVRSQVREFFNSAGFSKGWGNRLTLVVDELFMNAVKYGSRAGDTVQIELTKLEDSVQVAIHDQGAKQVSAAELREIIEHHDANMHARKTSGRGLALFTSSWTDSFEVQENEQHGLTVTFNKKIDPAEPTRSMMQ